MPGVDELKAEAGSALVEPAVQLDCSGPIHLDNCGRYVSQWRRGFIETVMPGVPEKWEG